MTIHKKGILLSILFNWTNQTNHLISRGQLDRDFSVRPKSLIASTSPPHACGGRPAGVVLPQTTRRVHPPPVSPTAGRKSRRRRRLRWSLAVDVHEASMRCRWERIWTVIKNDTIAMITSRYRIQIEYWRQRFIGSCLYTMSRCRSPWRSVWYTSYNNYHKIHYKICLVIDKIIY